MGRKQSIDLAAKFHHGLGRTVLYDLTTGLVLFEATEDIADAYAMNFADQIADAVWANGTNLVLEWDGEDI